MASPSTRPSGSAPWRSPAAAHPAPVADRPVAARRLGLLSVVVPCYNEEEVLPSTHERLLRLLESRYPGAFEIIYVDDGSRDRTSALLRVLQRGSPGVRVVIFSRNFGHQLAVSAGIDQARGDAVVLIDADLQDPPEVIPAMVERWEAGVDVVYGVRSARLGETAFKRWTAKAFYRVLNRLSDVAIPQDTGDFRLMDRRVVDVLRSMPEGDRFIRGMVAWAGFRQEGLSYQRDPRFAGETKYSFRKMVRFAVDGMVSFSIRPLRLATWLGFGAAGIALLGVAYAVLARLLTDQWVPGWAALFVAILFVGGVQLIALGVIGEYVGRLFMQSKARPMYVTAELLGTGSQGARNEDEVPQAISAWTVAGRR